MTQKIEITAKVGDRTYRLRPWGTCDAKHCSLFKDGVCDKEERNGKCPSYPCFGKKWQKLYGIVQELANCGFMVKEVCE